MKETLNKWRKYIAEDTSALELPNDPSATALGNPSEQEAYDPNTKTRIPFYEMFPKNK